MYDILLTIHSLLRYVLLFLLVFTFLISLVAFIRKTQYSIFHRKINFWSVTTLHLNVLIGFWLYFISPIVQFSSGFMKESTLRYWGVEHVSMMLIAVVLITIGSVKAKKTEKETGKHKKIVLFYGLGLLLILVSIYQSGRPILY